MAYVKVDNAIHNTNWLLPSSSTGNSTQQRFSSKARNAARVGSVSLPFILLLLDLWRLPIIILIATTGPPATCAYSIAVETPSSNTSDTHNIQEEVPSKRTFNSNEDGVLRAASQLPSTFESLALSNPKEIEPLTAKKAGIVERGGGEANKERSKSNQNVATLAFATNNSSSIAVGNINSSYNTIHVTVGASSGNPVRYPPQAKEKF